VLHGANGKGDGDYNYGRYSNARLDALIDQVKTELDVEKRRRLINEALLIEHDEFLLLPLHRQVIPWATRANVRAVHLANNNVIPQWVSVQ
jgi:peptide/nickel transport system substrate-binding protein